MQQSEFEQLASCGYNRIPLVRQLVADKDTPVSSYLKLARAPYTFLLESVEGGDKWGRYSIIGMPCKTVLRAYGHQVTITENGNVTESFECDDPLAYVETFRARYQSPEIEALPMFNGGLVGYFAYDAVRYVEKKLQDSCPPNDIGNPDILLMVTDEVLIFDNLSGTASFVVYVDPAQPDALANGKARLKALSENLKGPSPLLPDIAPFPPASSHIRESDFVSSFGEAEFQSAVSKVREYVLAGDVMQVVPSQRLSVEFKHDPFNLYRALRRMNPSPYMYYLNLEDFHVVGSSPEILARVEDGDVTVRPIAGTRKRGRDEAHDKALENELLADPKERAEHLMLIDLGRNDVGRVAKTGSVELTDKMIVERYSHVMHIVSNVRGKLREGLNAIDVLKAALPAGTLSGAPKIRAMEIIDELESVKRGVYGGAVGYIAWNGNMDTAIAIRTGVIKDETLYVQAGAGIVADSDPVSEWEETMNKARAIFAAAAMVSATEGEE